MNISLWILIWNASANVIVAALMWGLALWINLARRHRQFVNVAPIKAFETVFVTLGLGRLVQAFAVATSGFWIIPYSNSALVGVLGAIAWYLWSGRWRVPNGPVD